MKKPSISQRQDRAAQRLDGLGLKLDHECSVRKDDIYAMRNPGSNLPPLVAKGNTPPTGPCEEQASVAGGKTVASGMQDCERPITRRDERPPTRSRRDRRPSTRGGASGDHELLSTRGAPATQIQGVRGFTRVSSADGRMSSGSHLCTSDADGRRHLSRSHKGSNHPAAGRPCAQQQRDLLGFS